MLNLIRSKYPVFTLISLHDLNKDEEQTEMAFRVSNVTIMLDLLIHVQNKLNSEQQIYFYVSKTKLFDGDMNTYVEEIIKKENIRKFYYEINYKESKKIIQFKGSDYSDSLQQMKEISQNFDKYNNIAQSSYNYQPYVTQNLVQNSQLQHNTNHQIGNFQSQSNFNNQEKYQINEDQFQNKYNNEIFYLKQKIEVLTQNLNQVQQENLILQQSSKPLEYNQRHSYEKLIEKLNNNISEQKSEIEHLKAYNLKLIERIEQLQAIAYETQSNNTNQNLMKQQIISSNSEKLNNHQIQEQSQLLLSNGQRYNIDQNLNSKNYQQKNEYQQIDHQQSLQQEQKQTQKCLIEEIDQKIEFQNGCGHKLTQQKLEISVIKGLKEKKDPQCSKSRCKCKLSNDWQIQFPHLKIKIDEEINKYYFEKLKILYEKDKQKKIKSAKCQNSKCNYFCFWDNTNNYKNESYAFCQNCEKKSVKKPQ
ncbi:unnamed protein product [Paramecium sonneborni]|uniref:Uncharacterized protein n=1 Tax=Paramecium sonneborni TaxID=65129 RepID=A0A8S1LSX5_9CILI|nr:unnamed protein product [Paramecium sonneborni]